MKTEIRFAKENDVSTILGLVRELAAFEELAHEVTADEDTFRASLFGERPAAEVLLAERAGEVVGCAIFFHNFSTFLGRRGLYLEDLFVKPSERGHGVGQLLLSSLAQVAIDRKCGRMEWSVLNWNQKAIDLYSKIGANPQSEWTVYRLKDQSLIDLAAKSQE